MVTLIPSLAKKVMKIDAKGGNKIRESLNSWLDVLDELDEEDVQTYFEI